MHSSYSERVRQAFGLSAEEWASLPNECRLERMLDFAIDHMESNECDIAIVSAFRAEFGRMAREEPQQVRIPDYPQDLVMLRDQAL